MRQLHNMDPIDIQEMEARRRFDEEADEAYEQWLNTEGNGSL